MRFAYSLFVVVALFTLGTAPGLSARGPFGLFSDTRCCDSCCDDSCCDAMDCDAMSDSCCDSGCGNNCCERDRCERTHSLKNMFRVDCCPRRYCSLVGGWNDLEDYNGENIIPPPTIRRGSFNDGWAIGVARGRQLNDAIRGEFEFAFRSNTADQWEINGVPAGQWSGHFHSYSLMANLYHEFASLGIAGWTPYVGGGLGIAFLDGDFTTTTLNLEIDDEEFAYQFIAGGSKPLRSNLDAFVEYRYFATTNFDLINNTPAPPIAFGRDPYEAHNVFLGLRIYR